MMTLPRDLYPWPGLEIWYAWRAVTVLLSIGMFTDPIIVSLEKVFSL